MISLGGAFGSTLMGSLRRSCCARPKRRRPVGS
jgi:hypothetical protein